ncbi:MAG: alpha/beta hydrolase-fold protein [Saprospiraceae bacterium]
MRLSIFFIGFVIPLSFFAQVPTGQIKGPFKFHSKIYPGTERNYWLYIPVQYDAGKPACSMIVQDGLSRANGWKLSEHLDTLIANKDIPVMIGIYIDHGRVLSKDTTNYPRYNRSFEYDGLGDQYARFLIEEIIPEVKKSYNLSDNPDDRCITGASSGAICAFNAAWERPDLFHRVFSTIGTYVGLRGADEMATLVRKTEPKPLRIYLEDGYNDLNIYAGDWYLTNQYMLSALTWAGYEVNHAWGEGAHSSTHALTIITDALKWIWKDWPNPVTAHLDAYKGMPIIKNQDGWKEVNTGIAYLDRVTSNSTGEVYFTSRDANGIWHLGSDGTIDALKQYNKSYNEIAFDAEDHLIYCNKSTNSIMLADKIWPKALVDGIKSDRFETTPEGFYFNHTNLNKLGYYNFKSKKVSYIPVSSKVTGIALNAEQSFLNVMQDNAVFGTSYKINADGTLEYGQSYIHYHIPYGSKTAEPRSGVIDTANILYTATNMGVQISDQLGRVNMILPAPGVFVSDLAFGGVDMNQLYIISNGKLYMRKLNTRGKLSTMHSLKPPRPGM